MTICSWKFTLPDAANLRGLSLRAKKASTWKENDEATWTRLWDVEASGALTSTTDAVKIYQNDGTLVGTLKGSDDPAEWEFDFSATSGKFVAVFESDLNNPVPKKGFDLMYAGKYGASAGRMGGFCSDKWDCVEGACRGGTCKDTDGKGGEIPMIVIVLIVVISVLLVAVVVFVVAVVVVVGIVIMMTISVYF